ncbi:MAG: glutamine synthetase III [Oscillospiraceae bacterium]|nr:glutamine synthetase III [Oscillospiraceae bacterium]
MNNQNVNENGTCVPEMFGSLVFSDAVMRDRLPSDVHQAITNTMSLGTPLDPAILDVVANVMKDWAIEKGATHYTHWFQPMTGITAEKHDSFITPTSDGQVIMKFSGKDLVRGEPDASSFPSGGLRVTFEARGYTGWDPTSYAFVKDGTLYLPTVFYSYSGQVLDKKTPLLRSMEVLNVQANRVLALFGKQPCRVVPNTGAEQEYFLIDKKMYKKRKDLKFTGRTLFGAKPPKGQEMDDHYFGSLNPRVAAYMKDLDEELWKFGVLSKTKHNEVAPAQHELAPIFTTTNIATDHNQLTMEIMKKVAARHNLVCLLHEKPFANVNGSGKHNNWSLSCMSGSEKNANLLDPGDSPRDNAQFLLFLCSVIKAVDEYPDLLRIAVASAGNDRRLGGGEAPPAIISIFLGDELTDILESLSNGENASQHKAKTLELGVDSLPKIPQDTTDRNRTSPFAFTGNKFEFRMLGSPKSIASTNYILNTIVAESLRQFSDRLEKASDFTKELNLLIKDVYKKHKRVIFNGNNYSDEWVKEAAARGLPNYQTTVDCLPHFVAQKNIELFERHKILSRVEVQSRMEILLENYAKTLNIEVLTLVDMVRKNILPSVIEFSNALSRGMFYKAWTFFGSCKAEKTLLRKASKLCDELYSLIEDLQATNISAQNIADMEERAKYYKAEILPHMDKTRGIIDTLEEFTPTEYWKLPTYSDLLFTV